MGRQSLDGNGGGESTAKADGDLGCHVGGIRRAVFWEGEAPAEPLSRLTHIDCAARQEPRPPTVSPLILSCDKALGGFRHDVNHA
jgi:hypothetical protein